MNNKLNYYFITLFVFGDSIQKFRGTWASLFTTLFFFIIIYFIKVPIIIISLLLFVIIIYAYIAIKSCLNNFENKDPQEVVIDEFIGQSIPIISYEIFHSERTNTSVEILQIYFWFFLLFRVFDGLKPFPIDYIDKNYKNTFGILFDDILAGIYVIICLILFMVGKTFFF